MEFYTIELKNLPKISLNKYYSGMHWSKRKELKDIYKLIVRSQFKGVLSKDFTYKCAYHFFFKKNPLDVINCAAMVKMIEDVIFENDKPNVIPEIVITSGKDSADCVIINIKKYERKNN